MVGAGSQRFDSTCPPVYSVKLSIISVAFADSRLSALVIDHYYSY